MSTALARLEPFVAGLGKSILREAVAELAAAQQEIERLEGSEKGLNKYIAKLQARENEIKELKSQLNKMAGWSIKC